jgi:dTDP-4-dehydrorhamnose 3,5-epimerase-like enzyme
MRVSLNNIKELKLPVIQDDRGTLQILQRGEIPLSRIQRTFIIQAKGNTQRGYHSHKTCSQLMVCLQGHIDIFCDDGESKKTYSLKETDSIMIPPGIWSHQEYKGKSNILAVWCDMNFEEEDYIRAYEEFVESKK